tara:strand:- start:1851 stop:2081 length:231 start_codon:yes stop_codon:yes gene_type:complete
MAYKIGGWIGSIRQAVPEEPTAQPPNFFGKVGFLGEKKTPSFILYLLFLWAVVPPNCEVIITTTVHTLFYFGGNGK